MTLVLDIAWLLVKVLSYGGFIVCFAGVIIFGWYFVRLNARAARSDTAGIPREAWRGRGAMFGIRVLGFGAGMQIASIILSVALPGRL